MRILLCTHLLIVAASLAAAQGPNAPASELNTIDAPEVCLRDNVYKINTIIFHT